MEVLENQSVSANISIDKAGAYIFRLQVEKEGFLSFPDYVVFNAVLPTGTETFNPDTASFELPISQCAEITRIITVENPADKEFFVLFENQGVEEVFATLNGQQLTGRFEYGNSTSVYPVSLEASNTLSLRLRGLSSNSLKVKVIEKSSSQVFGTTPAVTANDINVVLGRSGSVSLTGGTGLTYSVLEEPLYGSATVNSSGRVTYTSDGAMTGKDLILVKAVDSNGLVSVVLINVNICSF